MSKVSLTPSAAADFDDLPIVIQARIVRVLERLESWPTVSGAKPLSGPLAGKYRIRSGDYRLQFGVARGQVVVEKIGHRNGFYED